MKLFLAFRIDRELLELCKNPVVGTIIENQMYDALNDLLKAQFQATAIDFTMVYDLKGALQASYPRVVDTSWIEQNFSVAPLGNGYWLC